MQRRRGKGLNHIQMMVVGKNTIHAKIKRVFCSAVWANPSLIWVGLSVFLSRFQTSPAGRISDSGGKGIGD